MCVRLENQCFLNVILYPVETQTLKNVLKYASYSNILETKYHLIISAYTKPNLLTYHLIYGRNRRFIGIPFQKFN